ncbi:MAG: hypothetical protein QOJ94_698 [Sphingomonadales bacterium]|jgi:cell division septation protein DedD|nr:hypothetical protein [Sphingomonadales bacterium]
MTDIRADDADRDDRLPWLEAVDEDEAGEGPSALKLIVAVLIGLAAIGALVGGAFWIANRAHDEGGSGEAQVIKAPPGDYKVKPDKPGGMAVEGEGGTAFAASTGAEPKGQINPNAVPETPVTQKGPDSAAPPEPQPKAAPAPAPAAPKAQPPAAPAAPGSTIQLGAFADGATAERVWKGLSGRFTYLAPLSHSVVQAQVNGKTWYRLRASGPGAADVCGRLRVAGENCLRID